MPKYLPTRLFRPGDIIVERYVLIRPVLDGEPVTWRDGDTTPINNALQNKWWVRREDSEKEFIVFVDGVERKNAIRPKRPA